MTTTVQPLTKQKNEKRVSFITEAFLRETKEDSTRPNIIIGVLYFKENPGLENVRNVVRERLIKYDRFRSIPVVSGKPNHEKWGFRELPLEEIDLNYHVELLFENEVVSREDIDKWSGDRYSMEIDMTKPLWKFHLIPKIDDGRVALVYVGNHALTDGVALVEVLMGLVDEVSPDTRVPNKRKKPPKMKSPIRKARVVLKGVMLAAIGVLGNPKRDTPNKLKIKDITKPSNNRACGSTDKISLAKLKEIKDAVEGATVNDILLTLLNLIVAEYFKSEQPDIISKKTLLRGIFPVNVRKAGAPITKKELGNNFSLGAFQFFFDFKSRLDLLKRVKQELDDLKVSPYSILGYKLAKVAVPSLPNSEAIEKNRSFLKTASAMLSNVAGPQTTVALAGKEVDELCFYTLTAQGVYLGVLTYKGDVTATVALDETCESDPSKLTRHWVPEFEKLYEEVMKYKNEHGKIKIPQRMF